MTDDLRTRIAAVLLPGYTYDPSEHPDEWSARMADAVILELGLTIQVAGPDGIAYGKHRYVTDWIAND